MQLFDPVVEWEIQILGKENASVNNSKISSQPQHFSLLTARPCKKFRFSSPFSSPKHWKFLIIG